MTAAVVQSARGGASSDLSVQAVLDNPPADGNYLIGAYADTDDTGTVTLPSGWVWHGGAPLVQSGRQCGIAYRLVSGDSATVTFSSDFASRKSLVVVEVSGLATADVEGPGNFTGNDAGVTSKNAGSTGVLPQADMYALGLVNLAGSSGGSNAVDSGFTLRETDAGLSDTLLAADNITSSTAAVDPTFSWLDSRAAYGQIATFKAAVATPPISAFMPDIVVEIAFASTPDDPAPVWTDVSEWVEAKTPITISSGRSDELSEIQPSRLQVTFDNSDGRFTPGNAVSPYFPNVKKGRRIRVSATPVGSTVRRRFTGYVDEWPVVWPQATDEYAATTVTASSRRSRLAAAEELRSIITEEILPDGPVAYYPLGEAFVPPVPGRAGDVSGNNQPDLVATGTGPGIQWQEATGPGTDGLSAPVFSDGRYLEMTAPLVDDVDDRSFTIEAFVNTTDSGTERVAVALFGTGNQYKYIGITTSGQATAVSAELGQPLDYRLTSSAGVNDGETHHIAVRENGPSLDPTVTLFVDGVEVDSLGDGGSGTFTFELRRLVVGSFAPAGGPQSGGWVGSIAHVAVTVTDEPFVDSVTDTRIQAHADAGLTGFEGESSDARIERIARYAGIPDAEVVTTSGETLSMAVQQTDGKTAVELMEEVATTEQGAVVDAGDGTLIFYSRSTRYQTPTLPVLDAGLSQEVEASIEARLDGQHLVNDITASRPNGATVRVTDEASIAEHGVHRQQVELFTTDDSEVIDAADWLLHLHADPDVRVHSVSVDLLNSGVPLRQETLLDLALFTDQIAIENLPAQAPTARYDGFVEGITETIGAESYTISFELSPAAPFDVWLLQVFGSSELDETAILAF